MNARGSRHRGWIRRHPVLTGLWCVNAVVWLLAMLANYDDDLLISIAALVILVAGGTLVVLGLGWIIDRAQGFRHRADPPDIAAPDQAAAFGLSGPAGPQPADRLTDGTKWFDEELEESEAAQWRHLMRDRRVRADHFDPSAAKSNPFAPAGPSAATRGFPPVSALKADRFCPVCGAAFEGNEPFCRQCGARRDGV